MWGCKTSFVTRPKTISDSLASRNQIQATTDSDWNPTQRERESNRRAMMARASHDHQNKAGAFFMATLVMWAVSVFFEILFNKRTELVWILSGFCFYQLANWVVRNWVSRDPLFVNTCVSLLHSSITSASGYPICFLPLFLSVSVCVWYNINMQYSWVAACFISRQSKNTRTQQKTHK